MSRDKVDTVLASRGWEYRPAYGKGLVGLALVEAATGKELHVIRAATAERAQEQLDQYVLIADAERLALLRAALDQYVLIADAERLALLRAAVLFKAQQAVSRACDELGTAGGLLDEAGSYDLRERCSRAVRDLEAIRDAIASGRSR